MLPRAPVVTVMGHVDHGKTSLWTPCAKPTSPPRKPAASPSISALTRLRSATGRRSPSLIPGTRSVSEMRARGAKVTDIVVLVVAANDGIMPQTVEAIRHAQAAEVPIVVAINKIDLPGADPLKVKTALLQHGIAVEEMGGESLCAEVSAKSGSTSTNWWKRSCCRRKFLTSKPIRPARPAVPSSRPKWKKAAVRLPLCWYRKAP